MDSTSSNERTFNFDIQNNKDLTTGSRVAAAFKTIREAKGFDRLLNYEKKPLLDEVETQSMKVVDESEKIHQKIDAEVHRRTQFEQIWREYAKVKIGRITNLTYPLLGIFYCLLLLLIAILKIFIGPVTFELNTLPLAQTPYFLFLLAMLAILVMQLVVFSLAFEIAKKRMERHAKTDFPKASVSDEIMNLSSASEYWVPSVSLLIAFILIAYFLAQYAISPTLAILLSTGFAAILILLFIGYTVYERRLIPSQDASDVRITVDYKREQDSKAEHLRSIDQIVMDKVIAIVRELENEYHLNLSRWRTTIPDFPSAKSWMHLGEYYDTYIDTGNLTVLRESISNLPRGSIGVTGERGAGKTAMMKQLQKDLELSRQNNYLTVWMSAPTSVNERELPISILAKLATCVGKQLSGNKSWPDYPSGESLRVNDHYRRWTRRGVYAFILALSTGVISYILPTIYSEPTTTIQSLMVYSKVVSVLFAFCSVLCFVYRARYFSARSYFFRPRNVAEATSDKTVSKADQPLVSSSVNLLEALWYERKDTRSSDVSLSWGGASIGSRVGTEKTREPFTLPRLVDMWQEYVEQITRKRFGKVIIFIDEIDKLGGRARIEQFMRVLKALYDAPNVFFIVSISKDAYDWFHERHSPIKDRNIFDSSFSNMLLVQLQRVDDLEKLLSVRVIEQEFPTPVVQLIWVLSYGNPRDAQRLAVEIIRFHQGKRLRDVSGHLCAKQFRWVFEPYRVSVHDNGLYSASLTRLASGNVITSEFSSDIQEAIRDLKTWIESSDDDADIQALSSQIIAELQYALDVYSIFCCYKNVSTFRNLHNLEFDQLIRSVRERLSQQHPHEAQELLMKLRSQAALK